MAANASESGELGNLRLLQKQCGGNLSSKYIIQLLDDFTHDGPNGAHQCLVLELLGPTVDTVLKDYCEGDDNLEPEDILRMSTQLLKAVRFIHSAGMCHGGKIIFPGGVIVVWRSYIDLVSDISGRNIAFTCNKLLNSPEKGFFDVLGFPEIEPLARIDGAPLDNGLPTQLVKAAEWVDWIDEDEEDIRLLDFGESFLEGEQPEKLAQPSNLQVPETIFTDHFDYRLDLWRAGCMVRQAPFLLFACSNNPNRATKFRSTLSCSRSTHFGILTPTNLWFSK
jgi:serine/threonine-protein kinase SRPK3